MTADILDFLRLVSAGLGLISCITLPWIKLLQTRIEGLQSGIARNDKDFQELRIKHEKLAHDLHEHMLYVSREIHTKDEVREMIAQEIKPVKDSNVRIEQLLMKLLGRFMENDK